MGERDFGLGRLRAPFDGRDTRYAMRGAMSLVADAIGAPKPRKRAYKMAAPLDQGRKPHCVAFAGKGFMLGAPLMQDPGYDTTSVYNECQKADEWPGEEYDGTSVRALMKVLQARGWIESYVWAQTIEEATRWMNGGYGMVIIGTNWYAEMDDVDGDGFIAEPSNFATPIGGHAYVVNWFDQKIETSRRKTYREGYLALNSWDRQWGIRKRSGERTGTAYLSRAFFERLLKEDGEIGAPTQVRIAPRVQ